MSSTPLISICLPVFNGAKHLAAAIESVLAQDFENFELLIADDGSSDASAEIARECAARDKRIRFWKNETRQGLFGNYNACIKQSGGKYIKPYAQDDVLAPDALATLFAVLEKEPGVALVSSARNIIDEAGQVTELKQPIAEDLRAAGREVIMFHLIGLNNWVGEPSTVMFRAEYAGTGFDTSYYHYGDIEYWFRVLMNGDYCYLQRPLACFRRHADSQTDKNHRELYFALDILRLSLDYRHVLADLESTPLLRRRLSEKIALEQGHVIESARPDDLFVRYVNAFMNCTEDAGTPAALLRSQADGFRLLASMSLSTVSDLLAELDHEKRCRAEEHDRFVAEVSKMRNSLYWKLSNPLRKMRDAIKAKSEI